jgi:hypothetical protein
MPLRSTPSSGSSITPAPGAVSGPGSRPTPPPPPPSCQQPSPTLSTSIVAPPAAADSAADPGAVAAPSASSPSCSSSDSVGLTPRPSLPGVGGVGGGVGVGGGCTGRRARGHTRPHTIPCAAGVRAASWPARCATISHLRVCNPRPMPPRRPLRALCRHRAPVRAFPSSIIRDKKRCDTGQSQSK